MRSRQLLVWAEIYHLTRDQSTHPHFYNIPAMRSLNIRMHPVHTFPLHFFKTNLIHPSVFRTYKRVSPLRLPKKFVFVSYFSFAFHLLRRNPNALFDHLKQHTMKNRNFDNAMHRRFHIENQEVSMWNLRCRNVSFNKKTTISEKNRPPKAQYKIIFIG
jgi:hypothetical protein